MNVQGLQDHVIKVEAAPPGCVWVVTRAEAIRMTGPAPSPQSARRCGALAVAALEALDRIGRRRF